MSIEREAAIVGTIGAIIVCGGLGWWLTSIKDEWPLWQFVGLCVTGFLCLALIAWRLDKSDAARKAERERSGRS